VGVNLDKLSNLYPYPW